MKRYLFIGLGLALALLVQAASPVPNVGNGRLRVLGNNLQNYYVNFNFGRGNYSQSEITAKTRKIVTAMVTADADIYAFCEVEAKPIVLQQLADSMNAYVGVEGRYAAATDGIDVDWNEEYDNNLKSGFIYRTDKVKPYQGNYPATTTNYYKYVMRIQAWEELLTSERFTLSMNHFKAMSDDASVTMRVTNAQWLVNALKQSSKVKDPDILILGDLNAEMDEQAMINLVNAGYEEQLLRFDENAYSYIYHNSHELIDHALANASMAEQITGAAVWHANTSASSSNRYSDHDPYLVAMDLGGPLGPGDDECEPIQFSETFASGLGNFTAFNIAGNSTWYHNSNYSCAYINAYQTVPDDDWLVSPAFDLTRQISGEICFTQALGYGTTSNWPNQCMLLISEDYSGDVAAATWTQLPITEWSASRFAWVDNTIAIPSTFMGKSNVHFAFHYAATSSAPAWEIKNLTLQTVCGTSTTTPVVKEAIPAVPNVQKILRNGQIVIIRSGVEYTITGQRR